MRQPLTAAFENVTTVPLALSGNCQAPVHKGTFPIDRESQYDRGCPTCVACTPGIGGGAILRRQSQGRELQW